MKIGFFYVPYYPLTMGRSVHGYNLVRALKKRGHTILSCLGDGDPECIHYERSRAGAIRLARSADVLYIRIAGRPVHSYLERSTLLKLLRPFSLPVVWEVNAPVEELQGSYPPGSERDAMIKRENSKRKALAHLVDAGIGVSDVLKRYISDVLSIKKSYFIPNGSDPALFDPARAAETVLDRFPDTFKVFWMGNAGTPWQGIELMLEVAEKMERLDRRLLFLATVGSTAPFVGLFGTVWGIMVSFQAIAVSKNTNLAVVAPGIAEALFATAIGLVAAIPAVVFYNKFSADSAAISQRLEAFADEFSAIVSRQIDVRS